MLGIIFISVHMENDVRDNLISVQQYSFQSNNTSISVLCVLMKIISHASVQRKQKS